MDLVMAALDPNYVIGPVCGLLGVAGKGVWDYLRGKKALAVDDGTQLRKDLLEERKTLLNQLLAERQFYSGKVEALEKRIDNLEEENRQKARENLEQQKTINDLRSEIELLKSHEQKADY